MHSWAYEVGIAGVAANTSITHLNQAGETEEPGVRKAHLEAAHAFAVKYAEQLASMLGLAATADADPEQPEPSANLHLAGKAASKKPRKGAEAGGNA